MLGLGDLGGKALQCHLGMDEPGIDRQPRPQVRPDAHHDDTEHRRQGSSASTALASTA